MPERRTPLYENHLRLGAQMIKGGGDYMFPLSYTSPVEEHINTRTNVGVLVDHVGLTAPLPIRFPFPSASRAVNVAVCPT